MRCAPSPGQSPGPTHASLGDEWLTWFPSLNSLLVLRTVVFAITAAPSLTATVKDVRVLDTIKHLAWFIALRLNGTALAPTHIGVENPPLPHLTLHTS